MGQVVISVCGGVGRASLSLCLGPLSLLAAVSESSVEILRTGV